MAAREIILNNGTIIKEGGRYTYEICESYLFFEITKIGYKHIHNNTYVYGFKDNGFVPQHVNHTISIKSTLDEPLWIPYIERKSNWKHFLFS